MASIVACEAAGEGSMPSLLTKCLQYLGVILMAVILPNTVLTLYAQTEAVDAMVHLKKACEIVWARGTSYQIDRCTRRAMAALGDENRLRDNELKRLLIQTDKELDTCKDALEKSSK